MQSLINSLRGQQPRNHITDDTEEIHGDLESQHEHHRGEERDPRSAPPLAIPCLGARRLRSAALTHRAILDSEALSLWGWPSRGGAIVLEQPTPVDYTFLNLNPLDPPLNRASNQDEEDAFCRALLRLGATWWADENRRSFVRALATLDEDAVNDIEGELQPLPTRRERRWVRVGWPAAGGVWVAEFETNVMGFNENKNLLPVDAGRVCLARTMEERCTVLQRLGGRFFSSIEEYNGSGCLRAWEERDIETKSGISVLAPSE